MDGSVDADPVTNKKTRLRIFGAGVAETSFYYSNFLAIGLYVKAPPPPVDIEYYVFDTHTPPKPENYGVEIFDDSGKTIFHSGWWPLKIINSYFYPSGVTLTKEASEYWNEFFSYFYTQTPPSGKKMAFAMPAKRLSRSNLFNEVTTQVDRAGSTNSGRFRIEVGTGGSYAEGYTSPSNGYLLLADVTNFPLNYGQ